MIEYSESFLRSVKKLSKKFIHLKQDLHRAVKEIENDNFGIYLGNDLYKKRVSNSSIPTGKSGGFRIIIYKKIEHNIVLISMYSKSDKDSLTTEELQQAIDSYMKEYK
jgi:hypothetical protein